MGEKSYRLEISLVNNNTGEVLGKSCKPCTMFCNGDGEQRISEWVSCLVRGLRSQSDGLTLELSFKPVVPIEQPLIFV